MPRGEPSWLDSGKFRAYPSETGDWFFVYSAVVLEGYKELTKELACPIAIIKDRFLDRFLESSQQIVGGKETGTKASLNLEGILPLHGLGPALDVREVAW